MEQIRRAYVEIYEVEPTVDEIITFGLTSYKHDLTNLKQTHNENLKMRRGKYPT